MCHIYRSEFNSVTVSGNKRNGKYSLCLEQLCTSIVFIVAVETYGGVEIWGGGPVVSGTLLFLYFSILDILYLFLIMEI